MRGFKLAYRRHITHAVDKMNNGFAHALAQDVFTYHVGISQREQHCCTQRVDIHAQHGENFYHLHATPQQQIRIRMPLCLLEAVRPGFG